MFKELDDVIKQGGKTALGTNPPLCILFFHFLLIYFSVDSFLFSPVAAKQAQEAKKRLFQAVLSSSDELFHASFYDNLLQVDQSQVLLDVCALFSFSLLFFFSALCNLARSAALAQLRAYELSNRLGPGGFPLSLRGWLSPNSTFPIQGWLLFYVMFIYYVYDINTFFFFLCFFCVIFRRSCVVFTLYLRRFCIIFRKLIN